MGGAGAYGAQSGLHRGHRAQEAAAWLGLRREAVLPPEPEEYAKDDTVMRERTRMHHDLVDYYGISAVERFKDSDPMEYPADLIREPEGLTIYRIN